MASRRLSAVGRTGERDGTTAVGALGRRARAQLDKVIAAEQGDPITNRILDAGLGQFEVLGFRHATMLDIARAAGLARKTIYRRFANKDALVEGVMLREVARVLRQIEETTGDLPTIEERLVEGFVVALRATRRHPLLNRVLATEPDALPYLTTGAGTALGILHALLLDGLSRLRDGAESGFDDEVVTEGLLRFAHSYLLTRHIALPLNNDSQVRAFARRYLAAVSPTKVEGAPSAPRSSHSVSRIR